MNTIPLTASVLSDCKAKEPFWRMLCGFVVLLVIPFSVAAEECHSLDQLNWLAGNWESETDKRLITETWVRISPNSAEGAGEVYSTEKGKLMSRESLRLVAMSGAVYFIAKVAHNDLPVAFRLTACADNLAVFENPEHDFPQKLAYRLTADGQLVTEVSGSDGQGFSIQFKAATRPKKRIALTFDDAPRDDTGIFTGQQRTDELLARLKSVSAPPVMIFSVGERAATQAGRRRMEQYVQAGHYIGNHSQTHQRIDQLGVDDYVEDIRAAHEVLSGFETFVPIYRYPYLDEGRTVEAQQEIRRQLESLGYSNGYVTVDNYDWYMDYLVQQGLKQGLEVDHVKLRELYVKTLMEAVRFYDDIAEEALVRAPVHVLLLHENDIAALYIDYLIRALRSEGWFIVDAMEAYNDPIAQMVPDTLFNGQGRIAAIAEAGGMARRELVPEAEDESYLQQLFDRSEIFLKIDGDPAH